MEQYSEVLICFNMFYASLTQFLLAAILDTVLDFETCCLTMEVAESCFTNPEPPLYKLLCFPITVVLNAT